jgi:hypothetical protein
MVVLLLAIFLLLGAPASFLLLGRAFERLTFGRKITDTRPGGERWYHRKTNPALKRPHTNSPY